MDHKYDFCGWATKNDLRCSDGRIIRRGAFKENDGETVPLVWNHQHDTPLRRKFKMDHKYDFCGWATKNDLRCSDGRIIRRGAFKENDGETVPLVWNHQHDTAENVLGHALLENRDDGVFAYCSFNDTEAGQIGKTLVQHKDVVSLSIYANNLKQLGSEVVHGAIREVSLVLAGANPGARIQNVIMHSEDGDNEAILCCGEETLELYHAEEKIEEEKKMVESNGKTIQDVIDSMNDDQKKVLDYLVGKAISYDENEDSNEEEEEMKHNAFDKEEYVNNNVLSHSDMTAIFAEAKKCGSLRSAVENYSDGGDIIAHAGTYDETHGIVDGTSTSGLSYGIANIDYLFPEARNLNNPPYMINNRTEWVDVVMRSVHHTPFSRIKSSYADITADEARAKGYIKGNAKTEEVFGLLKRTTSPTMVYKKQKLDRQDIIDITDFDVVAWMKKEMRGKLDEELAAAYLFGDRRLVNSDDKIDENCIRPIWTDADLFTIKYGFTPAQNATEEAIAKQFIKLAKKRKDYRGSGNLIAFMSEDMLDTCLNIEDLNGRVIYDSVDKLATAMRVNRIVTCPLMDNLTRSTSETTGTGINAVTKNYTNQLVALLINLNDYNVGADKGGEVSMFEDFDIDYNQEKYLIETYCSGALTVPKSAIAIEKKTLIPSGNGGSGSGGESGGSGSGSGDEGGDT